MTSFFSHMRFVSQSSPMRLLKYAGCIAALAGSLLSAPAFSLLGPSTKPYQVPEIGYNLPGDIGGSHEHRRGMAVEYSVIYYAFDQTSSITSAPTASLKLRRRSSF
jgi:hypothetical protein